MAMPTPKPMSTGKWLSKKERRPLQQLYLAPPNFGPHQVRQGPKWKDASIPSPMPTKQATLDRFLTAPRIRTKKREHQIEGQSGNHSHDKYDENASIESVSPLSSPLAEFKEGIEETPGSSKKQTAKRHELTLSPTRHSPRLQAQRSRLKPKSPLSVVASPSLQHHDSNPSPAAHTMSVPSFFPSPPINSRTAPVDTPPTLSLSYHTALSSTVDASSAPSNLQEISRTGEDPSQECLSCSNEKEIPSSIPWENTPSDGYGDTWPSSQSDRASLHSSQVKSSIRDPQPRYSEGFRVPDPPAKPGSADALGESQPSPSRSSSTLSSEQYTSPNRNTSFHTPNDLFWPQGELGDIFTQDDSQPSNRSTGRKRKRVSSTDEVPDFVGSDTSFSQLRINDLPIAATENSVTLLSQAPPSMRKNRPEVIAIHSTQSQSQEHIPPPGPRPTSQSLSQPFARVDSEDSQTSSGHHNQHNWTSSQPTQSAVGPVVELSSMANPPSQMQLSSQNEWSRIPEPLAMTLAYGFPRKKSYEHLPDLDKLENDQEKVLQKWEAEHQIMYKKSK